MPGKFDQIVANNFFLDLGSSQVSNLTEVSGLEDESDVSEFHQVGKKGEIYVNKTLGAMPLKSGKLTIKYAAFKEDPVKAWYDNVVNQKIQDVRTNITLHLFEVGKDSPTLSFSFANAWPSKYSFSSLTAKGNDPLSVTVTIEHSGMDVKGYNS